MCLGTIGQITTVGPGLSVRVRAGGREITASLLALSEAGATGGSEGSGGSGLSEVSEVSEVSEASEGSEGSGDVVVPGDWVLVHSGLVLNLLTGPEARDALGLRGPTSVRAT